MTLLCIISFKKLISSGMAPFFMRKCHPKFLFLTATFITTMSMVLVGIFVFLQKFYPDSPNLGFFSWMPLLFVILPSIMRAIAIVPVLHSLLSELFPTEIRTQAIGLIQAFDWGGWAISVKFFPEMKNNFSFHGLFFMFGATGLFNCLWGFRTIPDNRGKSLIKVEEMYENKSVEE